MHRTRPALDRLRKVPLFSACADDELQVIYDHTNEVNIRAGDVLATEGRSGREFVVILEGTAKVLVGGREVATLQPGDFFGEVALLDGGPRTATVVAETEVRAEVSSKQEFDELIERAPHLARNLLVGLARRLRAADLMLMH
jgi:CRP-like cAMP-binding protein